MLRRQSGVRWNAKKVVVVVGQVEQVNRGAGEWGLLTDQGVKTGKVAPAGHDLNGLQVGKRYRFKCAEVTEQDALGRLFRRKYGACGRSCQALGESERPPKLKRAARRRYARET